MSLARTLTALAVVGALAASAEAGAQGSAASRNTRREVDTTFFFSKLGTVVLGNGAATVIVTGWDQTSIHVKARSDDGTLRFEGNPTHVVLETMRLTDNAIIQVTVPRGVRVVTRTNTG